MLVQQLLALAQTRRTTPLRAARRTFVHTRLSILFCAVSAVALAVGEARSQTPGPPVFVTEAHFAVDQNTSGLNRATLSLNASGTNTFLLAALHVEFDGGDPNWVATDNGAPGTLLLKTDGYTGGAGNQRFQVFYWVNPPAGTNNIVIQNTYTGSNEITVSAVLLQNVSQAGPLGAMTLDVSPTGRTSESETVATTATDLVLHLIADAVVIRGTLGAGESSVSVANDGLQKLNAGDGDASLWISTKLGASPTTTVSSSGWPSGPSPSPRPLNVVALVLHSAGADVQAPSAPTGLVVTPGSASQIMPVWTAATFADSSVSMRHGRVLRAKVVPEEGIEPSRGVNPTGF